MMKKILFALLIILFLIPNVDAATIYNWNVNIDQYTDVQMRSCTSSSCSTTFTNQPVETTQSDGSIFVYQKNTASFDNTYGAMILNYHRYVTGYLYSHTSYICTSSSMSIKSVEKYVGSYSATINKDGNLTYHQYLSQTLSSAPFDMPEFTYTNCYAITDLFVPYVDGQNIGTVIIPNSSYSGNFYLIGETFESLGLYTDTVANSISTIINNSGLASATSVEEVQSSVNEVKQEVSNIDNSINNTDTSGSSDTANSFFEGFESDDYGLSDIITMPLDLIKGLTNNTCVALSLTIPFVNKNFELPCMSSIYSQYFGNFYSLYQTITFGFISYWVIVKIFALVKGFKDPDDDKIEVVDL